MESWVRLAALVHVPHTNLRAWAMRARCGEGGGIAGARCRHHAVLCPMEPCAHARCTVRGSNRATTAWLPFTLISRTRRYHLPRPLPRCQRCCWLVPALLAGSTRALHARCGARWQWAREGAWIDIDSFWTTGLASSGLAPVACVVCCSTGTHMAAAATQRIQAPPPPPPPGGQGISRRPGCSTAATI